MESVAGRQGRHRPAVPQKIPVTAEGGEVAAVMGQVGAQASLTGAPSGREVPVDNIEELVAAEESPPGLVGDGGINAACGLAIARIGVLDDEAFGSALSGRFGMPKSA